MEWGDLEWITSYERGNEAADVSRTEIRRHFHLIDYQRVNKQQKKNPKNSRRLVFFFGKDVAERYGTLLLFGKKKIIAELEAERERERAAIATRSTELCGTLTIESVTVSVN